MSTAPVLAPLPVFFFVVPTSHVSLPRPSHHPRSAVRSAPRIRAPLLLVVLHHLQESTDFVSTAI